jgi:hypothetical protein
MNYINRRRGSGGGIVKALKDYIVPIIGILLIFVLLFWIFWDRNPESGRDTENQV